MIETPDIREKLLKDLEETYMRAIEKGNFTAALKAKELIGKEMGLFEAPAKKKSKKDSHQLDFKKLSDADIQNLISVLQKAISEMEAEIEESPQLL